MTTDNRVKTLTVGMNDKIITEREVLTAQGIPSICQTCAKRERGCICNPTWGNSNCEAYETRKEGE